MPTNDFIGFASAGSANILSQADFAAAAEQTDGVQPGPASSSLANKVWRQGANMAAAIGRLIAARGYDALDNGDLNALQSSVDDAVSVGTFNRTFFSQTSGTYTAPRTGVYRITLKGGGGGGGHPSSSSQLGGGGGEGGEICFYVTLVKNTAYTYSIGAGGTAGSNGSAATTGGSSQIIVGGTTYSVTGGGYGRNSSTPAFAGGRGGYTFAPSPLTNGYFTPGQSGAPGGSSNTDRRYSMGGGCSDTDFGTALYGAGGRGAGGSLTASDGGDGFILIEYAG